MQLVTHLPDKDSIIWRRRSLLPTRLTSQSFEGGTRAVKADEVSLSAASTSWSNVVRSAGESVNGRSVDSCDLDMTYLFRIERSAPRGLISRAAIAV